MKDLNSLELRKKLDAILNSAAGKDGAFIQANIQSVHSIPAKKIDSPLLDKATVVENISISAAPVRKMQEGGLSKPARRIFIANTPKRWQEDQEDRSTVLMRGSQIDDTFEQEAKAAAALSKAQGIPYEIITIQDEEDWNRKVRPLVDKYKGTGTQWGIFGHSLQFGADPAIVDEIMSNTDEVFLGSCSGPYCAKKFPKTKQNTNLITNSGTIYTGPPRFRNPKAKFEQYKNVEGDPFLNLIYGNNPDYKFEGPAKYGENYISWKTYDPKKLSEKEKERLVQLRALSELRHEAHVRGLERPSQLPPGYEISSMQRAGILYDLGIVDNIIDAPGVTIPDILFDGEPYDETDLKKLKSFLDNTQEDKEVFWYETGIPWEDANSFYSRITSTEGDKVQPIANRQPQVTSLQRKKQGGESRLQKMLGSSISKYDKYSNVLEDLFNEQDYSVPSFQDSGEVNAQTPVTTPQQDGGPKKPSKRIFFAFAPDGDDTFIKESKQAARISMATEGVPAEIVVLQNKQDFLDKVPEILRQNKDTEFGIFTHAESFFKVPKKKVNQIISENMDEGCKLGLYSCFGMSQASNIFPDVKNIVHNIGTPWTGVPRFRTQAEYDALKGKSFAQVMYSINPEGKYRPNVKEGIDYVDTTSFKNEEERKKFYEDAIVRQAEEMALRGLRYGARLENRTPPNRLPRNFNLEPYISRVRRELGEQMADQTGLQSGMSTRLVDINSGDVIEDQNTFPSRERWHMERNIPITDESNNQYEEERYEFTETGRPYVRPQPNEPVLIQPIQTRPLPVLRSNITRAKQGGIAHFQNAGKTTTSNYSWSTPSTYGSDNQVKPASKSQYATTYTEDTEAMRIQKSINDAAAQIINKNPKDFTEQDAAIIEKATNISDKNKYLDPYRIAVSDRAKQRGEFSDTKTFAESTGALGPKMSLQQLPIIGEYIPEALDVTRGIGEMASGLGRVPYNIQEGNYGQAAFGVALPLAVGALGGLGARSTGQFVNNLVNPLAGTGELLTTKTPLRNLYKINPFANKNPLYSNLPSEGELIRVPFRETTSRIENISNNIDYFQAGDGLPYPAARGSETWQQLRNDPRFKIIKTDTTPSAVVDFPVPFGEDLTDPQKLPIPLSRLNEYRFSENIYGRPDWLRGYRNYESNLENSLIGITPSDIDKIKNANIPEQLKKEAIRFLSLKKSFNPEANSVLRDFQERIQTPEGQRRLRNLGITETEILKNLSIVEDPQSYAYYWAEKIGLNPTFPQSYVKKATRHEIEHAVQDAFSATSKENITEIDKSLENLELRYTPSQIEKKDPGVKEDINILPSKFYDALSNQKVATDYFAFGSKGQEKSAFLGELQQYLVDEGFVFHPYDKITPDMIEDAYFYARNDDLGDGKFLRIFNIMKPTENNYKLIADNLNKMLALLPAAAIGASATQKDDIILNRKQGGGIQQGGTVSRLQQMLGYKDNSPYKNLPYQDIYSDRITMQGVSRPLFARTDTGVSTIMQPGKDYYFPGASKVREIPIYQNSGKTVKKANAKEELKQITTEGLIPFVNISQEEKDALSLIASDYNISYRDLNTLLNKMAFQETGGTMSPTLEQKLDEGVRFNSNEHGVGLFQYNVPSAETSAKRAINYLNSKSLPIPSWIIDLRDNPQNISKLPASRQKILAAYDIAVKPNFSIRNALFGDESLSKEWGRGWQTKSEPVKMRQFVTNASKYADLAPLYPKEQLSFTDILSGKKQPLDFNILRIK